MPHSALLSITFFPIIQKLHRAIALPEGVSASLRAIEQLSHHRNDHQQALQRQLQQAEYEAQRAFLQYDQADPSNRLVVDTLEQRWNQKLELVEQVKSEYFAAQVATQTLNERDEQSLIELGNHFIVSPWEG